MTKTSKKLLKQHLKKFFTNLTKLQLSINKFQRFLAGVLELDLVAVQLDQHPGNRQRLVKLSFKPFGPLELPKCHLGSSEAGKSLYFLARAQAWGVV